MTAIPINPTCARKGCHQPGRAYLVTIEDLLVYRVCPAHARFFADHGGATTYLPPITKTSQYPAFA